MLAALLNSLELALISCGLSILLGTAGAVGLAKSRFKGKRLLEDLAVIPIMIPEIILGIAYLAFFSFVRLPYGMTTMVIAHTSFCVPYILINVQARLAGLNPSYVEAARDLGASSGRAFFDITLPLILPAVFSGALLAFAMSMDDLVISFFTAGPRTNTLPILVFSMLKKGVTPQINALCTLMLAAVLLAIGVGALLSRRKTKR